MYLDHSILISRKPLKINKVGSIKPIFLYEIEDLGFQEYESYISLLFLDKDSYYSWVKDEKHDYFRFYNEQQKKSVLDTEETYHRLPKKEKEKISFYDLMIHDEILVETMISVLNFFIEENVEFVIDGADYTDAQLSFVTYVEEECVEHVKDGDRVKQIKAIRKREIGRIGYENYSDVANVILSRNHKYLKEQEEKDRSGVNEKKLNELLGIFDEEDKEIIEKRIKEGYVMDDSLSNIISTYVAKNKNGINMLNVWDMTIYNLYDQFNLEIANSIYEFNCNAVAHNGTGGKEFDVISWYKNHKV